MSALRHKTTDIDAKAIKTAGNDGASLGDGILASFAAVLTTNQEDRDHDILEPSGAVIDESMPLLWQHSQSDPIGRYVETVTRSAEKIVARFEVADTPLGRDTVLLLKLGILRVSIGFVPIETESRTTESGSGYHIKKYEIVEVSLVSVPSNDQAVILSLTTKSLESQPVKAWVEHLTTKGKAMTTETQTPPAETKAGAIDTNAIKNAVTEGITAAFVTLMKDANGNVVVVNSGNTNAAGTKGHTPADLLNAGGSGATDVRVKSVGEKYSKETHAVKHFKTGQAVKTADGHEQQSVSELNNAKAGAFLKKLASKKGAPVVLREEDEALLELAFGEKWCGHIGNEYHPEIDGVRAKALLNDSVSGGSAAVPYFFDVDLISFPLLQGELFPYVDLRNVPRGNSVHGASVANPTVSWGVPSGTDIPLFDTSSLVAALNTNITTVTCAITVGLDFLSDSPADVGRILTENVGQRLSAELDRVTAVGNGSTEPTGIFNASGTTTVHSANNTTDCCSASASSIAIRRCVVASSATT